VVFLPRTNRLKKLLDFIFTKLVLRTGDVRKLLNLHKEIAGKDWFMTLLDLKDYMRAKEIALKEYEDRQAWTKKMLVNITKAGFFSSDRTIAQYNDEI